MTGCDVLVVDDDAATRDSIVEALEGEGMAVESAPDGEVGLAVARRHTPKVVILDMMMPVMNGWEFLSALQNDPQLSRVPVIQASAFLSERTPPAVGRLHKPIEHDDLIATVRRFLPVPAKL